MDELTKYRMTGAIVWLGLLVIIVPSWYGSPVDYVQKQNLFTIESVAQSANLPDAFLPAKLTADTSSVPAPDKSMPTVSSVTPHIEAPAKSVEPLGQWWVRLASYSNTQSASRLVDQLANRYQATIGDFSTQDRRIYSVRIGPFNHLNEALEAKKALDAEFNIDSVIVKVTQ
ncbi:SPOR domain-containing protein [Thiomicrospira microaerophila]|uniref:SPOR domain-containing protein n=1 Tax=Thiomicrospira microaerophila TaxID=406020 RepID=UPI0005CB390E|nr:SPOR domain-containing protein [Thiomicrospira microaerophila]